VFRSPTLLHVDIFMDVFELLAVFEYFDDPWLVAEFDLLRLVDLGADIIIILLNYISKDTSNEEEAEGNI
jgi:hypothetical protein